MTSEVLSIHQKSEVVDRAFLAAVDYFWSCPGPKKLITEGWTRAEYGSVMTEVFHYTKQNPQLQALATVFFRGDDRKYVKAFFGHAASEIGHDEMALHDAVRMGVNASVARRSAPLPATLALTSFGFYQIYNRRPVGYLGYLYFLEHFGTSQAQKVGSGFAKSGIEREAMSFLQEHATADVGHNRLMELYLKDLVRSEIDLAEMVYSIRVMGTLYAGIMSQACERALNPAAHDYGVDVTETYSP